MKSRMSTIILMSLATVCLVTMTAVWSCAFAQDSQDAVSRRLQEIRKAIEEKGAQWIAGETSVSRLSLEEKRRLCGAIVVEIPEEVERSMGPLDAPATFDWRDVSGDDWTTPIRDQGACGSCVAFANVSALEALIKIKNNTPSTNYDLSEAHLFYCGCGACCLTGWNLRAAARNIMYVGVPDEACFPYVDHFVPCATRCSDWRSRAYDVQSWTFVNNATEDIKNALLISPLPTTMTVYDDFFDYTGGIYEHVSGDSVGGHAITLVGYNENDDYWICKNSWDTDWGESGWFRIKYGEANFGANTTRFWDPGKPPRVRAPISSAGGLAVLTIALSTLAILLMIRRLKKEAISVG